MQPIHRAASGRDAVGEGQWLGRCSSTRILRRWQKVENLVRFIDRVVRQLRQVECQRIVIVGFVSPPSQTIQHVGDALTFADLLTRVEIAKGADRDRCYQTEYGQAQGQGLA